MHGSGKYSVYLDVVLLFLGYERILCNNKKYVVRQMMNKMMMIMIMAKIEIDINKDEDSHDDN